MYEVTKQIHFCYGHRLLKHPGKCARLHGHNAVAEIVCRREKLDSNQMVVDFEKISTSIKTWIMEKLDHRMILSVRDPLAPFLKKQKEAFFPMADDPTAEAIARVIYDEATRRGLPVSRVVFWETPSSSATYSSK